MRAAFNRGLDLRDANQPAAATSLLSIAWHACLANTACVRHLAAAPDTVVAAARDVAKYAKILVRSLPCEAALERTAVLEGAVLAFVDCTRACQVCAVRFGMHGRLRVCWYMLLGRYWDPLHLHVR